MIELNKLANKYKVSNEMVKTENYRSRYLQYVATITGNLSVVSGLAGLGWTSPILPKLLQDDPISSSNPLGRAITTNEGAWIGSLVLLGAAFGSLVAGYFAERFGRKRTLLFTALPFTIGWTFIALAEQLSFIFVARLIFGFALAFPFTVLPLYVGEIAETPIRGALGSFIQPSCTIGLLYAYCIGPYVSYDGFWIACICLPILFFICFLPMPESPYYLLIRGKKEEAISVLVRLRGTTRQIAELEIVEIQEVLDKEYKTQAKYSDLFKVKANLRALTYTFALTSLQQMSGIDVVVFYMENIFIDAGSGLSGSVSTILVGIVQMLASFITPLIVDKVGRRILLVISGVGEVISLGGLGLYFYLKYVDETYVTNITWLPVVSLIIFIASYSVGWGPLPWTIIGEMFASDIKSKASGIVVATSWSVDFLVTKFASNMAEALGNYVIFTGFSFFCMIGILLVIFCLPETRGKTFREIQEELNGNSKPSFDIFSISATK